jgi:hypothetical protein
VTILAQPLAEHSPLFQFAAYAGLYGLAYTIGTLLR